LEEYRKVFLLERRDLQNKILRILDNEHACNV
jgi:hypothetical protein